MSLQARCLCLRSPRSAACSAILLLANLPRSSSNPPPPPGLAFTHVNGATGQYYMPRDDGAGVALFDYDNDGDLDVFLVQGGALATRRQSASAGRRAGCSATISPSRGSGELRFTDVTERAGVGCATYGMGAAVGDYDNDGDLDLFVTSFGPKRCIATTATARSPTSRRGRRQRPALEHERRVRRLRPRRRSRSVRRQLPRLHARRQQAVPRPARRARLLQPARLSSGARSALSQRGQRPLHRRHRRAGIARPTAPASASRPATTTATAGSISTSPTTRRRTSSGSTSERHVRRRRAAVRDRR